LLAEPRDDSAGEVAGERARVIVLVMGVTGAGKTTVGGLLAEQLGWEFVDADRFHSAENVEKMRQGIRLSDADRGPWLRAIHEEIVKWVSEGRNVVLACSALKQSYREQLLIGPEVQLVYLRGSREVIASRLRQRQGHFVGEGLLASQFEDLEEPSGRISVDVERGPGEIVGEIRARLGLG
jgi:gluconokinase